MMFVRIGLCLALLSASAACGKSKGSAPTTPAERGLQTLEAKVDFNGDALPARAEGPTVVVVFASWCGPCRKELATLGQLRAEDSSLRVIGLNAYESFDNLSDETKLRSFLSKAAPWLPVVRDDGTLLKAFGGVPKIPTMFIYDADGSIVKEFRRGRQKLPSRQELSDAVTAARG